MDRWGVSSGTESNDTGTSVDDAAPTPTPGPATIMEDERSVTLTTGAPSPGEPQALLDELPPLLPSSPLLASAFRSASQSWLQPPSLPSVAMRSRSHGVGRGSVSVPGYSSVVVVLGFLRNTDGSPTEALRLRLDKAYELWNDLSERAGTPQAVLVTGGDVQELGETEASTM